MPPASYIKLDRNGSIFDATVDPFLFGKLHIARCFSHRLSRKQIFKGFPHFFERGATGALHDFDRPSGCGKNTSKQTKYEEKEMLRLSPEVDQIMSQPIYENILWMFLVPITQVT